MKKTNNAKLNTLKNRGYTLVELLVSMTLTAIFATALVALLPSATRVYMQIENLNRAQVVADMVVDALREECSDTYIEDFASVRIVNAAATEVGDNNMLTSLIDITSESASNGNVLFIRKSGGYCEGIFSDIAICSTNYADIKSNDDGYRYDSGISSRAVYRLFPDGTASDEVSQGYVHYGFYQCGRKNRTYASPTYGAKEISCIYPAIRYDYTNPFNINAYNGYTVKLNFSNLKYGPEYGEQHYSVADLYTVRPSSVDVTVSVYKCGYNDQAASEPVYSRTATLVFAKDTTKT